MLYGKSIAIAGAVQGIGKATARPCAKFGANVAVCDINGLLAQSVCDTIESSGSRAIAVEMDVSHRSDCHRIFTSAVHAFGRSDGLVCDGMRRAYQPAEDLSEDAWAMGVGQGHRLLSCA